MSELITELIVTADMFAKGRKSPAFYGYDGPEFVDWLASREAEPHRTLVGRKTYRVLSAVPKDAQDDDYRRMTENPGWVFSSTLKTLDWPGLEIVRGNLLRNVRRWKREGGPEIRTVGSLSLVRQLVAAGLVDRFRLIICPIVLPQTGAEPVFKGYDDLAFDLLDTKVLDGKVVIHDYRPSGQPPGLDE